MLTTWSSGSKRPKSIDGSPAIKCDARGLPTKNGKYISWTEYDNNGNILNRIAKIVKPKKITKFNPNNIDLSSPTRPQLIKRMTIRVFQKIGVSFSDALKAVKISDKVKIAGWVTDGIKEEVLINPYFFQQKFLIIHNIIKRTLMHRAFFRGRPHLKDKELLAFVVEVVVNRLLAEAKSGKKHKRWDEFCEWIYSDESERTIVALCNSAISEKNKNWLKMNEPEIHKMWCELYEEKDRSVVKKNRKGVTVIKKVKNCLPVAFFEMSIDDLYFKFKKFMSKNDKDEIKEHAIMETDIEKQINRLNVNGELSESRTSNTESVEKAIKKSLLDPKVSRQLNWESFSNLMTEFWDRNYVRAGQASLKELTAYAEKIATNKILYDAVGQLLENFLVDSKTSLLPVDLTEDGFRNISIGLCPPYFPYYLVRDGMSGKHRVVVFFDLSPSMTDMFPHIVTMCSSMEDVMDMAFARNDDGDSGTYAFGGSVKEVTHKEYDEMKRGNIPVSRSTCFDELIRYCNNKISTEETDAVVIFTDGESSLNDDVASAFNSLGKKCYRMYMRPKAQNTGTPWTSDLDKLTGQSFTLYLPRTDSHG